MPSLVKLAVPAWCPGLRRGGRSLGIGIDVPAFGPGMTGTGPTARVVRLWVAATVAARCTAVTVDRDERKPTAGEGKPSDHAPLIIALTADGQ
jgi:hypothetical protein